MRIGSLCLNPNNPEQVGVDTARGWEPLRFHLFTRSPHSGAGNCVCGGSFEHVRHPHEPVQIGTDPERCVCSRLISVHSLAGEAVNDWKSA